ncbi:phosphate/phosphite/phosphonate ABC transporter substrate-binding protein [uncultured Corynebacterium sp.]|uniref:phosphate/phosphite/phosphonate ABC transporter substrate-binding protein n=1 Tax=uncultured Corynebacterium sp. TaxID=159447 RepID=UPI0025975A4C|nr:phosphate/phosphite/phosphonate ABC transporter substrate-binding protein [uncultured Corynebacterium sp.]
MTSQITSTQNLTSWNSRRGILRSAFAAAASVALVGGLAACGSSSEDDKETLTFAAVPAESSQSLEATFSNVGKLLEEETGKKIEFQNASDYASVIEGQRAGKIDIASYGPFSYVIAKDSGINIDPMVAPTNDEDKAPAYHSLAYVKKGSDIRSLADVKGKRVCFVDQASTSGYLVPTDGLMKEDIDPKTDITPVMAGGHDASLLGLNTDQCDVAFAHDAMLETLSKSGQMDENSVESIWESEAIPEDPIVVNNDTVDKETADKIREALEKFANKPAMVEKGICPSEDECELPEEIEWGYLPVTDEDYNPIREVCETTKAEACSNVG